MASDGIGESLRRFRRGLDLAQEQMAERLGLKRSTYVSYEHEFANVPARVLRLMQAIGFGEAPEVSNPLFPSPVPQSLIPKGPAVPCSSWSDPLDTDYDDFQEVDSYMAGKGRFASEMVGDSNYDLIWPEDVCVWQSADSFKIGTMVLAVNSKLEATAAQLKHDGTDYILHKLNPKYEDVTSVHWKTVAYLVGIIRIQGTKRVAVYDPQGIRP